MSSGKYLHFALSINFCNFRSQCGTTFSSTFSASSQDGNNDFFSIPNDLIDQFNLQIYNRHGKLIYQTQDPNFKWHNIDQTSESATYTYYLQSKYKNDDIIYNITGNITQL